VGAGRAAGLGQAQARSTAPGVGAANCERKKEKGGREREGRKESGTRKERKGKRKEEKERKEKRKEGKKMEKGKEKGLEIRENC
jgi:hypothetical protein